MSSLSPKKIPGDGSNGSKIAAQSEAQADGDAANQIPGSCHIGYLTSWFL